MKTANTGDIIVRRTLLQVPTEPIKITNKGLDYFLSAVDEHMAFVASSIGATVVNHTWCLISKTDSLQPSILKRFNLPNFELGAQVEVLPGSILKPDHGNTEWETYNTLHQASDEFYLKNGWSIPDITVATQYMNTDVTGSMPQSITLVDIEPRVTNYRS
jgi:hypothetical protein